MSQSDELDRRRKTFRYRATLRMSFKYAGRRHQAITTEISPRGAAVVTDVQLPVGAILIFDVEESDQSAPDVRGARLIAQVSWAGPAPFGDSSSHSAGLELLRTSGGQWTGLLAHLKKRHRAESGVVIKEGSDSSGERSGMHDSGYGSGFEALFNHEGVWFRGEIVTASVSVIWIRTARMAPPMGAPIRVRIAVRDTGKLVAVDVNGRVPGSPIPAQGSRGWVFEVEIESVNRMELFERLIGRINQGDSPR